MMNRRSGAIKLVCPIHELMTWAVPPMRTKGGLTVVDVEGTPVSRTCTRRRGEPGRVASGMSMKKSRAPPLPALLLEVVDRCRVVVVVVARRVMGW